MKVDSWDCGVEYKILEKTPQREFSYVFRDEEARSEESAYERLVRKASTLIDGRQLFENVVHDFWGKWWDLWKRMKNLRKW